MSRRPNIWKLQANKDVQGLIEALQHIDPDVRKRSAAALRVLGNPEAVFGLARALERERNSDVRDHLSAALEYLDQDALVESLVENNNVPGLVEMLSSPRSEDVMRAARALGTIGDQQATEALVMVFRSPLMPDKIRLAAAEALLDLQSAPAVVTLLAALRKDNWRVRHNAAAVMGQLRATWATDPLIKALDDEHRMVRRTAAMALRRFNTPQANHAVDRFDTLEEQGKTRPLPDVLTAMEEIPVPQIHSSTEDEKAEDEKDTLPSATKGLREAIAEQQAQKSKEDGLSPAMAATEAALNELSLPGESLFDDEGDSPESNPQANET